MKTTTRHLFDSLALSLATCAALCTPLASAFAQGAAFTYQGRLNDGANPANGSYDLRFTLFGVSNGGGAIAGPVTNSAVAITNGLFAVLLDFGAGVFNGADRWMEIGVRTNGVGAFINLTPRQQITSAPYAVRAATAASSSNVIGSISAAQLTGTISSSNIANGTISGAMLASGAVGSNQLAAGAVTTAALAVGAVTASNIVSVPHWFPMPKIPNPTPAADDNFGYSAALFGSDRLIIGAPYDDTGANNAGAAYLFNTNGTLLTIFTNPAAPSQFGISVAGLGNNRVIVGTSFADAVYLFNTNGTLVNTITNPVPNLFESFGSAVAGFGNDRVLVGALGNSQAASRAGIAYLFRTNGVLITTFTNPTPANDDYFGATVVPVGNNRVLINAYNDDDTGATDSGAAYLFDTNGTLLVTFTNPSPAAFDFFGWAMAAVGNQHVLISAFGDDTTGLDAGAAYLFRTNGALVTTFNPPSNDFGFGLAVAPMGNDRVLISSESGIIYMFSTNGTLLSTILNPDPLGYGFGSVVAATGDDRVFTTAGNADTGARGSGAAYLLSLETITPDLVADRVSGGSITTASLQDGAVTAMKLDPTIGVWTRNGDDVYRPTGRVGIATTAPVFTLHVNGTAGKPGGGTWSTTSDVRLKKNIRPLASALDKLLALRGVSFEYIDPEKIHELSGERMGLLAQEVEKVFPDWVEIGADGYKRVTVRGLEALVVEGLRELRQKEDAEIRALNQKVEETRTELKFRDAENAELKTRLDRLERILEKEPVRETD